VSKKLKKEKKGRRKSKPPKKLVVKRRKRKTKDRPHILLPRRLSLRTPITPKHKSNLLTLKRKTREKP